MFGQSAIMSPWLEYLEWMIIRKVLSNEMVTEPWIMWRCLFADIKMVPFQMKFWQAQCCTNTQSGKPTFRFSVIPWLTLCYEAADEHCHADSCTNRHCSWCILTEFAGHVAKRTFSSKQMWLSWWCRSCAAYEDWSMSWFCLGDNHEVS